MLAGSVAILGQVFIMQGSCQIGSALDQVFRDEPLEYGKNVEIPQQQHRPEFRKDLEAFLVEKAAQDIGEENIKKTEENLKKGQFSMEDYLSQLRQMRKMGGIEGIMSFMPGVSKVKSQMDAAGIDESVITKNEAIILSMTKIKFGYLGSR